MNQQTAGTLVPISDSKISEIQAILTEVDTLLRGRLAAAGLEIGHVILAITPDGAGVVRSNVGPEGLNEHSMGRDGGCCVDEVHQCRFQLAGTALGHIHNGLGRTNGEH